MQNLCKHLLQCLANEITYPASILLVSTSAYFSHWLFWTNIFDYHPFPTVTGKTIRILGWENREESFSITRISFMTLGKAIYFLCFSFLTIKRTKRYFPLPVSGMKINVLAGKVMACPEEVINKRFLLQYVKALSEVISII